MSGSEEPSGREPEPTDAAQPLTPREFCVLQRALVGGMAMRKKRNLSMGPVQSLKVDLLAWLEQADSPADAFPGTVAEAVVTLSHGGPTGPLQAVASDLLMDWQMACTSEAFVAWLRDAGSRGERAAGEAASERIRQAAGARAQA